MERSEARYEAVLFDLFGTLVDERGDAVDGAARLLAGVPAERWAVVTSCPRRLAEALFERSGLTRPRTLVAAEDVAHGKPAPDCYLLAAELLGAAPEACLVVEDSMSGIAAALAADMDVVNVGEVALGDLTLVADEAGRLVRV